MNRIILYTLIVTLLIGAAVWRVTCTPSAPPPPSAIAFTPDVPLGPDERLVTVTGLLWTVGGNRRNAAGIKFTRYLMTDTAGRKYILPTLDTPQEIKAARRAGVDPEPFAYTNVEVVGVAQPIQTRAGTQYILSRLKSLKKIEGVVVPPAPAPKL